MALIATSIAIPALVHGSIRAARAAAGPWSLPPFGVATVAFGLAVSGFLVPTALVARLTGHLDPGLAAAALTGVGLAALRLAPTPRAAAPAGTRWAFAAVLAGLLAVYGYVAVEYQMHDEHAVFGHKSMVEQLRRGAYPPYYPSEPAEEARYHYGFDVMAGALARAYGLSSDAAIDLVCLLMVAFMAFGAAAVVADAGAVRSAPLAALAVHFGAGLGFVLLAGVAGRHPRCLVQYHHPTCAVELFPTQFLNVFQHPVSLGVPLLSLAVLLLPRMVTADLRGAGRAGLAAAALAGLAAASVGQFVYYALGSLAALAALPVWLWGRDRRARVGAAWLLAALVAAFGVAYLMGGMLAHNPSIDPELVARREVLGFPEKVPWTGILWHHAVNLGLGFVLVPVFAWAALRRRQPGVVMLLAFAVGGVTVAHLFVYTRSWDIVKFPSAAAYALSLLYVMVVDAALVARPAPWTWVRRAGATLLMGSGVLAAIYVVWPLQGDLRLYEPGRWQGDALVAETIAWWRGHAYRSKDVIYAQANVAKELSVFGGLSVVAEDADLYYMGVHQDELSAQRGASQRIRAAMDPAALEALGVRWVMFSNEELGNLGPRARAALQDPARFEVAATFPGEREARTRRIWRVLQP